MANESAKMKVLLVDDSKSVIELYKLGLSDDLYEKKIAMNGRDALEIYESWNPDMIVLDIVMPEVTGFTALKQIRRLEKTNGRHTAIVMATALSDKGDIVDCARIGIQGYIIKPFKHSEIASRLEGYYAAFQKTPKQ
ncbi:MAG: response regulator [Nitrospinae bacterium]|nr:response regulator [Nitrospinota bacterium]